MKKYLILIFTVLILTAQKAFCIVETVSPELEQSLKTNIHEPNFLSILFALLIVICLIYITGLIYSKLNIVGARTVQKQLKNYDLSKVIILSTTQLGQNKNLHVIEINKKRYLIGATPTSINLIKEIEDTSKSVKPAEKKDNNQDANTEQSFDDAIEALYGNEDIKPELSLESVKEFDLHKKYL